MTTEDELIAFAETIKHCGDYGILFWNTITNTVHWVAGDGDGDVDEGHTDLDDVERGFSAIEDVENVIIADEYFPDEEESGWRKLYW